MTSPAPEPPWCRPTTTHAPWPGQGTIAVELLEQLPGEPDLVIVPVGGGGCIAGITTYLSERTTNSAVLGAEPAGAASMMAALAAGTPVTLEHVDQFVDGAAVAKAGANPYAALAAAGEHVVDHLGRRGRGVFGDARPLPERGHHRRTRGSIVGGRVDGGRRRTRLHRGRASSPVAANDVSRYGEILERSLVHRGLKHYFLVDFPQEPGALRDFLDSVLGPNDDITLFEYVKRNNRETGEALVGIELGSSTDLDGLLQRMHESEAHVERLEPGSPLRTARSDLM